MNKRVKKNQKKTLHPPLKQLNKINETFGDRFDAEELSAKKRYEFALNSLRIYDEEKRKQASFDQAREERGITQRTARLKWKDDPKLGYDPNIVKPHRKTLENDLQDKKRKYLLYNPDDPELEGEFYDAFVGKSKKYEDPKVEIPEKNSEKILGIDKISPCVWYFWPIEVSESGINFGSMSTDDNVKSGVGPGEAWLEYMLGAKVQGGSVSFDLVTHDGRKWEVKQLLTKSDSVRPGTKGTQLYNKVRHKLTGLIDSIKDFIVAFDENKGVNSKLFDDKSLNIINTLRVFIDHEYEMIVNKGEIGADRIIRIRSMIRQVSKLKKTNKSLGNSHEISIGDRKISINSAIFADIIKRIEAETGETVVEDEGDSQLKSCLLSHFNSSYFDDPTGFLNEWYFSFKVPDVFEGVDGIFIVNPRGFILVPWDDISTSFEFTHITQNLPRFALKLPFGP